MLPPWRLSHSLRRLVSDCAARLAPVTRRSVWSPQPIVKPSVATRAIPTICFIGRASNSSFLPCTPLMGSSGRDAESTLLEAAEEGAMSVQVGVLPSIMDDEQAHQDVTGRVVDDAAGEGRRARAQPAEEERGEEHGEALRIEVEEEVPEREEDARQHDGREAHVDAEDVPPAREGGFESAL